MNKSLILLLTVLFLIPQAAPAEWYKGNTHTHTVNSDGGAAPDEVARWYKENGYQFLVITDHDFVTNVDGLNSILAAEEKFLVIPGEEVSDGAVAKDGRDVPIHLNAINIRKTIPAAGGKGVTETLQADVRAINAAGGLCQINHPNFGWALGVEDMAAAGDYKIFEIANAHPYVNNAGGGGMISTEALWDSLLTRGKKVFGVASDDAHGYRIFNERQANPGRAWVWVKADRLAAEDIVSAMSRGDFYCSTGVTLKDIKAEEKALTVEIAASARGDVKYTVYFIGRGGKVLSTVYDNPAVYKITGKEGYVRAKVVDSNGLIAWIQPLFIREK
jgi:hypothetical protein